MYELICISIWEGVGLLIGILCKTTDNALRCKVTLDSSWAIALLDKILLQFVLLSKRYFTFSLEPGNVG